MSLCGLRRSLQAGQNGQSTDDQSMLGRRSRILALQFPLAHPSAVSIILGVTNAYEASEKVASVDAVIS